MICRRFLHSQIKPCSEKLYYNQKRNYSPSSKLSKNSAPCYLAPNYTFTLTTETSLTSSVPLQHNAYSVGISSLKNTTPPLLTFWDPKILLPTHFHVHQCPTHFSLQHQNQDHSFLKQWPRASWRCHCAQQRLNVIFLLMTATCFIPNLTGAFDSHITLTQYLSISKTILFFSSYSLLTQHFIFPNFLTSIPLFAIVTPLNHHCHEKISS